MSARRHALTVGWLALVWVALWGVPSIPNILAGLAVGAATLAVVPPRAERPGRGSATLRPVSALWFLLYFLWALVRASAVVAWEVVTPTNDINQGIIAMPLRTRSYGVATLIANAISLTPGTLTIEVATDPLTLYVHVMHLHEVDTVRRDLRRLETFALRAFDPERSQEAVA